MDRITGKKLNELWKVGADHALYRQNGTWFNLLERFPGALFDVNGYILFNTRSEFEQFRERRGVTGHKEIAIQDGISSHPEYIRVQQAPPLELEL